jgi:hypothetical protein
MRPLGSISPSIASRKFLCHPEPFACHPEPFACHPERFACHPERFACHPEPSPVILSEAKDLALLRVNSAKDRMRLQLQDSSLRSE